MRFYKRLANFKAISFDLDDTLYDNHPVITKAEHQLQLCLQQLAPQCASLGPEFWQQQRQRIIAEQPSLAHDVSALRLAYIQLGMEQLGCDQRDAKAKSQQAFDHFLQHRNDFQVPHSVKALLLKLSQRYPLVAISNGNVNIDDIGLSDYFTASFFAGNGNLQKPEADMFAQASAALAINRAELLHVGDCTHADIYGAQAAGCQTIWINNSQFGIRKKPLKILPNAEFDSVEQLGLLI
ncbi:HAD-IA family hydrolase [Thalassotalea ponticola]|uniref:HAD-IA family hydrolase n=1 Tax=Thalassotalea ponticola TaxID=1523392 RepID=UPI0025B5113A|nr:HAD-IA family hydrolase [Thalassotalea ponticola]MDN3652781.1 HAD-IA family hydrolase [Thalassotalea ponticola]